jgi:hypothetical protein
VGKPHHRAGSSAHRLPRGAEGSDQWHSEVLFAADADALRRVADKIRNAPRA